MADRAGLMVSREADVLRVSMPAARNPWFIVSGVAFGAPWLVTVVAGTIFAAKNIPDERTVVVWAFALVAALALTGLLDVLAIATLWLALYASIGRETLEVTRHGARIRRVAGPTAWPIKLGRGLLDHVVRLDPAAAPGRVPHPTIELNLGRTKARIGAGISAEDADRLVVTLAAFIAEVGPVQDDSRAR